MHTAVYRSKKTTTRLIALVSSLTIICIIPMTIVSTQVPLGLALRSDASMDRIFLNPGLGTSVDHPWEVHIASGHLLAQTDYASIKNTSLIRLASTLDELIIAEGANEIPSSFSIPHLVFDQDGGQKMILGSLRILGPSLSIQLDGNRIGIFTQARAHLSSTDIPENFGIYEMNESYRTNVINIDRGAISGAAWAEIGLHFSKKLEDLSFGVNFKYLRAYEGLSMNSNTTESYPFIDSVVTVIGQPDYHIAFTNSSLNSNAFLPNVNGGGISFDFGTTLQYADKWTFGISILDVGVLQFTENIELYDRTTLSQINAIRTQDFRNNTSLRGFIDQVQRDLDVSPDLFGVMSVGLPTRMQLMADYIYNNQIRIGMSLSQRLPIFGNSLKAHNVLSVSPRYESGLFAAALPITLYEYTQPRLGISLSYGPLTIGSDHISSVLFSGPWDGTDIYMSFHVYPFWSSRSEDRKGSKEVLCPLF